MLTHLYGYFHMSNQCAHQRTAGLIVLTQGLGFLAGLEVIHSTTLFCAMSTKNCHRRSDLPAN